MHEKLIFTESGVSRERMAAYVKEDKLTEVCFYSEKQQSRLQNIYVGKVSSVAANLQAAFIEIEKDLPGYYPLEELPGAVFTSKMGKKPICPGDELLVQVTREGGGKKSPVLSTRLTMAGRYCLVSTGFTGIRCSSKLEEAERQTLTAQTEEALSEHPEPKYGLLLRTNSRFASGPMIAEEYLALSEQMEKLIESAAYRKNGSLLYKPSQDVTEYLNRFPQDSYEEILTDDENEYRQLLSKAPCPVRFYKNVDFPLAKLYNLDKQLEDAMYPRVWLKSGAYLVIQPTEALVSVDVNSGKCETGADKETVFLRINLEAAEEIARQLRLRRLSGIIIVDFINLRLAEHRKLLFNRLKDCLKEDPLHPVLVDITALGLAEITRKKSEKALCGFSKQRRIM